MATTSSTLVAGTAISGQGGNSNGHGSLKGKVALGAVTLGCAAALALGGLRAGTAARHQSQAAPVVASARASGVARQRFLADNRWLPTGTLPATFIPDQFTYREDRRSIVIPTFVPDQFTYREDHRVVAPASDLATIDFGPVECGAAPCVSASAFVPDQLTYREDHRLVVPTTDVVPDQFTYREDHRSR